MDFLKTLQDYRELGLIYSQVHPTLPLTIWNYTPETQYNQHWDDITLICRGLVTHSGGAVVAKGFPKFFNIEEGRHVPTDDFEVFEKLDGQLILVFWYEGEMVVASRGSFTSDYAVEARRILDQKYPDFERYISAKINLPTLTYCFELIGFEQIVVVYPEPDLVMTGLFIEDTEWKIVEDPRFKIRVARKFDGLDWRNIKQLNWANSEGFVVRFSNGQRCKIKFDDYIKLHRQMTNLSTTSIWEALAAGEPVSSILRDAPDEFYNKVHVYENRLKWKYNIIEERHRDHFNWIMKYMFELPGATFSRKLFAEHTRNTGCVPGLLFAMLDGMDYSKAIWKMVKPEFEKI